MPKTQGLSKQSNLKALLGRDYGIRHLLSLERKVYYTKARRFVKH